MKNKKNTEVADEETTRRGVLNEARKINCENEVKQFFDKYDKLLRNCTNKTEYDHISSVAIEELNKLFAWHRELYENGQPFFTKA